MFNSVEEFLEEVTAEHKKARRKFGPFNSPHEGYAVILEELDELWEHVRADTAHSGEAYKECVQIATMAMCFALEITGNDD